MAQDLLLRFGAALHVLANKFVTLRQAPFGSKPWLQTPSGVIIAL